MSSTCGARPCASALALLDAEAVLLVDDRDREVAQLDALLDQRVRADDDVGAERRSRAPSSATRSSAART